MLTAFTEIFRQAMAHRKATKEISKLCWALGLAHQQTSIWRELNSMHNPVVPSDNGESAFAVAYHCSSKEERCWGYLRYMVAVGDITGTSVKEALASFDILESLLDLLGLDRLDFMVKVDPEDWWKDETSCSCFTRRALQG